MNPLKTFLGEAGYQTFEPGQGDVRLLIAGLIQNALMLVGIIFFVVILYGGYMWLTAGGNEEQVKKARTFISRAIIGLLITLTALIITRAVAGLVYQTGAPTDTVEVGASEDQGFWCRYTGFGEGC